jgi:hypothetical protein
MDLYRALCDDHHRLDTLFEALIDAVHVDDAEAVQAAWTEVEQCLLAHLEAEEAHLLPVFDRFDPTESRIIRDEHAKIRGNLADLGVLLDLHALREDKVLELVAFLRGHAAREEAKLYPWATRELPAAPQQLVMHRLRGRRDGVDHPSALSEVSADTR